MSEHIPLDFEARTYIAEAKVEALRAENERLREALQRIVDVPEMPKPANAYIDESNYVDGWNAGLDRAQLEARAALAGEKQP